MGDYTIKAHIHQKWIPQFNASGMKFCFASCVEGEGSSGYNVVAYADDCAGNMTCAWQESYSIAASKNKLSDGVLITTATNPAKIQFKQVYPLKNWADPVIAPDASIPDGTFRFKNDVIASAVVYKKVNGDDVPVYISAAGPLPPMGYEDLTPKAKAKIWFSAKHKTSAMVSVYMGQVYEFDLTGKTSGEVWYGSDGMWYATKPADFQ